MVLDPLVQFFSKFPFDLGVLRIIRQVLEFVRIGLPVTVFAVAVSTLFAWLLFS